MKPVVNLFWFRRDLRLDDNTGLQYALRDKHPVVPVFIFDRNMLDEPVADRDCQAKFIRHTVKGIREALCRIGSDMDTRYGFPEEIFRQLIKDYNVGKVFVNREYEPYAAKRDTTIEILLKEAGISFHSFKDQVITEKDEVVKDDGKPYTVFSPYAKKWRAVVKESWLYSYPTKKYFKNFYRKEEFPLPVLSQMEFKPGGQKFPLPEWERKVISNYKQQRDIPSVQGTSRLSVHLRFGTISIRRLVREAGPLSESFLNELVWREFYHMILWHFPQVVDRAFKPAYDKIEWRNNEKEFEAWCKGQTGYPIVDAGMRELNETGYMHNRVRMIVASFLVKHLLIDWRWGEAYFARKLLDFDLAANNGGWQWAAGCGCDAAPYFRIFNPYLQTKKFDPHHRYIRKWVPEFEAPAYPLPVVEHEFARKRCLEAYRKALKK